MPLCFACNRRSARFNTVIACRRFSFVIRLNLPPLFYSVQLALFFYSVVFVVSAPFFIVWDLLDYSTRSTISGIFASFFIVSFIVTYSTRSTMSENISPGMILRLHQNFTTSLFSLYYYRLTAMRARYRTFFRGGK